MGQELPRLRRRLGPRQQRVEVRDRARRVAPRGRAVLEQPEELRGLGLDHAGRRRQRRVDLPSKVFQGGVKLLKHFYRNSLIRNAEHEVETRFFPE